MSSENTSTQMTIETMQSKVLNQKKFIDQLTEENEELFHQFNHLMVRNTKLLKRVDDLQNIIDDLHIRIEELQLINTNMLQMNDNLRRRTDMAITGSTELKKDGYRKSNPTSHDMKYFTTIEKVEDPADDFDLDALFNKWKNFPGQQASNAPNLRKQVLMLVHLYNNRKLSAADLFNLSGVGGVTGARYVSTLKKFNLIHFTGARKKGHYEITAKGKEFIENVSDPALEDPEFRETAMELARKRGIQAKYAIPGPVSTGDQHDDL